ncbi:Uncharacterised protein [Grimontia hollisae]|uniref:Uncharacterized protein n=1 Tax=Grimontia hollisae TaxID=673 RepID=A0A377HN92_GRIHO|nr:Uncharacterised protein [Grimontia hollisae]
MRLWGWPKNGGDWSSQAAGLEHVVLALAGRYFSPVDHFLDKPVTWLFDHLCALKAKQHEPT